MEFLFISDFCDLAGMGNGSIEILQARLEKKGVKPVAHVMGAKKDGTRFLSPLYLREQLAAVRPTGDRLATLEKRFNELLADLGEGCK